VRIGCHISVAEGFVHAVEQAGVLEADGFQYFTKSPRMLRFTRKFNQADAEAGRALADERGLVTIGHAPYLINLSAPEEDMRQASVDALKWDLEIAHARGSFGVVVHCGKHKGTGVTAGIDRMRQSLEAVLRDAPPILLMLENTAGQGSEIGSTVEELLQLVDGLAVPDRLGFCLDTQHAFAAGQLDPTRLDEFSGFHHPEYQERLWAVHLNDSKVPFGHRADRHELIGRGYIGDDGIRRLLLNPHLSALPFFLETPVADEMQYRDEIRRCRELIRH
jgi:deoxyribonuclease-4